MIKIICKTISRWFRILYRAITTALLWVMNLILEILLSISAFILKSIRAISDKSEVYGTMGIMASFGLLFLLALIILTVSNISMILGSDGDKYRALGEGLHRPRPVVIPATRGRILSSDGRPIAITSTQEDLAFLFSNSIIDILYENPEHLTSEQKQYQTELRDSIYKGFEQLSLQLAEMYSTPNKPVSAKTLKEKWIRALKARKYVPLISRSITYIERMQLESKPPLAPQFIKTDKGYSKRTTASLLQQLLAAPTAQDSRLYPFGNLARRSIGLVHMDTTMINPDINKREDIMKGITGLEAYYNDTLRGKSGLGIQKYSGNVRVINLQRPPVQGADIYTSLDMNKQSIVTQITSNYLEQFGAKRGCVILMEVATGRILAITNLTRLSNGSYSELENIAMTDMSEPGSTFKTASMMVALDEGQVTPTDTIDVGNGLWRIGGRELRDHNHGRGYGRISASQVLEYSSNVGIAKIITKAYQRNPDHFIDKLRAIGFTKPLGLDLNNVSLGKIKKRSENPKDWYGTSLAWISHGYETKIPPIYTLTFYNAIANGGKMMAPHFATKIDHHDGNIEEIQPKVLRPSICKPSTAQQLQEMLRRVVTHGTGKKLKNDIVSISGKSGTAKLLMEHITRDPKTGNIHKTYSYTDEKGHPHYQLSFCAFFPSEQPKYSCIAVVRDPSIPNPGGGSTAGPIVRDIAIALTAMEDPQKLSSITGTQSSAKSVYVATGQQQEIVVALERVGLSIRGGVQTPDAKYISVDKELVSREVKSVKPEVIPNLVGMSATDASYRLLSLGYVPQCTGYGNVLSQSIPMGTTARRGTVVRLQLGIE